jgi:DNA-binding GntR family transcriptional regulator
MNSLSPGAVENFMPVAQVIGFLVLILLAVAGGLWRGFVWLDTRIATRIAGWADSKDFKAAVADIVSQAFAATSDLNNRQHEEHRRGIAELRKRDDERADAVKRLHGRVDSVWERVGTK